MTKAAALYRFFSSFGIPAYVNTSVPDDAKPPYLTYTYATSSFENEAVSLTVNLWYRTTSEAIPNAKAEEIGVRIDEMYPIPCDGGAIWMKRGSPFNQAVPDNDDPAIKRRYMNITAEYLTKH